MAAPQGYMYNTDLNDDWQTYNRIGGTGGMWALNNLTGERKPVTFNLEGASYDDLVNWSKPYLNADSEGAGVFGRMPNINGVHMNTGQYDDGTYYFTRSGDPNAPSGLDTLYTRNPDGSIKTDYYKNDSDSGFLKDMAGFALAATGMNLGINALAGGAGTSAGVGSSAVPVGEGGLVVDPAGMGLTGSGGIGAAPSVIEAGAGAGGYGGAAATAAGGGGMFDGLLDKAIDFGTSKAGSALLGGLLGGASSNGPDSTTTTNRVEIDPRMAAILYGSNGNNGFLSQVMANQASPQSDGLVNFGKGINDYLSDWAAPNLADSQRAAQRLQGSNLSAPTAGAAQIQAPSQNSLNLSPAYQDMVYGQAGNNPYLTGAIQKGINQSQNAFSDMLSSATRNITESILPSIRGGARVSGNYGSDREGIAQGKALDTFNTQIGQAMQRFGQGNTDAAVAAQAGAYDADRNRSLAAMSGLGAQQYGVASQNAQMQQQANLANLQAQLQTQALNSENQRAGIGLSSGLLGQAYNYGTNQDQYAGQKLGQTAGLLAPFTGLGTTQTQTTPLYNNTAGGVLGGALAGLSLYNAFK